MIPKKKEDNYTFMSSEIFSDKYNNSQKIKESQFKSFSSNISNYQSLSPKNRTKIRLNQLRKKVEFSDISSSNLKLSYKKNNYSNSSIPKIMKPFSFSPKKCKTSKFLSIKKIENYIKQKIVDISMKLGNGDLDLSEFENNNCNSVTMPSVQVSKIIKKAESGLESSSPASNRRGDKIKIVLGKKILNNENRKKEYIKKMNEKIYRKIEKKNIVYDSVDDSDFFHERDKLGFYFSSDSIFALIFDSSIFLCTTFDVIYTPFRLSLVLCFCMNFTKKINFIYYCIDLLYISDLVFSFFRTQYDKDLKAIKESEIIIKNYYTSQFILDFLVAIPIFSIISFLCKKNEDYCAEYSFSFNQTLLLFLCYLKQLKLIKVIDRKKNSSINKILNIIANKHNIEKTVKIIKWTIYCLCAIYIFVSIHIFIGQQSYPNWIISMGLKNNNYSSLYITSFYFLMETVSTVGYGDIVCKSILEICFQIIFLTVGVFIYSWIISNIGNYIKNQDRIAIKCNKDERILEEIRIAYPEMPYKLYNQILQHLKSRKLRQQKCEINILINSLPFSLRNEVLLTIYKQTIDHLKIFKNFPNSDFTIRLLTSFIPLFSKKNSLIIHEGELIESIIFVNDGRLALEASIDIEYPEHSVYQYLFENFKDINEIGSTTNTFSSSNGSYIIPQNFLDFRRAESILEKAINSSYNKNVFSSSFETSIAKQVGRYDYDGNFEECNYKYINIINILKNENYGSVYMFLEKPSPLSLRVKSKKAELFLLRKFDAFAISKRHLNIWKRFQRKAYINMVSVKKVAIKIIKDYCKINCIVPIQRNPNRKYMSEFFNNSSYNNRDSLRSTNTYFMKSVSNQSSILKSKTSTITMSKGIIRFSDKKLNNNDLLNNINETIKNKKNDNKKNDNENENQHKYFNSTKEINKNLSKELNKELNKDTVKKKKSAEISVSELNRISSEDNKKNNKKKNLSFNKLSSSANRILSTTNATNFVKRKSSSFNANTASFGIGNRKSTKIEPSQYISFGNFNESKKSSLIPNSGISPICNKNKVFEKKSEKSFNEIIENKSEDNKGNHELSITNIPLVTTKKKVSNKLINSISSFSPKKNRKRNKLKDISKIRYNFIRKLTKKIKKLKSEKKKYKYLSKSLTHDFNEFVKQHSINTEDNAIKSKKTLEIIENKEITNKIKDINQIQTQNNIINNVTLQNKNFLKQIPEFSSSESQNEEEEYSYSNSKHFSINQLSISSPLKFMCKSKYKNLNTISLGYYEKSKKLRKSVKNVIKIFLSTKTQILIDEDQKSNIKEIINKKRKSSSSKTDSLNEYPFHVYAGNILKNEEKSNPKKLKNLLQFNSDSEYSPIKKKFNQVNMFKKYKNDDNIKNNNDQNYCTYVVSFPQDENEGNTNIIKLEDMNYLSISPSRLAVKSPHNNNKEKNNFLISLFNKKICNNTEYEIEHVFNNNSHGHLKKSYTVTENNNLMKIGTISSCYIRNKTKYLVDQKMKLEDANKIINKSVNNLNNINEDKGRKKSKNNVCYIF